MRMGRRGAEVVETRLAGRAEGTLAVDPRSIDAAGWLVLAALAVVVVGQGGFYLQDRTVTEILVLLGGGLLVTGGFAARRLRQLRWALMGLGAAAASTAIAGLVDGHPRGVPGIILLIVCLAVAVMASAPPAAGARRLMADAVLWVGAFAAMSGWIGVAFHVAPLGHVDAGLWRAATTVTYSNASAAILSMLGLWALARLSTTPASRGGVQVWNGVAVIVLTGLGATVSRAGFASFAVGLVVLGALGGFRSLARRGWPAVAGAAVGAAGLVPGMRSPGPERPVWAVLGLVAGLAVALTIGSLPDSLRGRARGRVWLAGLLMCAVGAAVFGAVTGHLHVWSGRLSLSSPDRGQAAKAAMHLWKSHLAAGVGPGRTVLIWVEAGHRLVFDRFAHDEYLQWGTEQGIIGIAGLVGLVVGAGLTLVRGWLEKVPDGGDGTLRGLRAGAVAGLAAFFFHSGFDFLWHVPAVLLVAAVGIGLAAPTGRLEEQYKTNEPLPKRRLHAS
jgi:hypothetical protein